MPAPTKEKPHHVRAFEYWCKISSGRTTGHIMEEVCQFAGVKRRALAYWYSAFHWKERYLERFEQTRDIERQRTSDVMLKTSEDYRRIIAKGIDQFEEAIDDGRVPTDKIPDFVKLVNLDRTIIGQPTSEGTNIVIVSAVPRPGQTPSPQQLKGKNPPQLVEAKGEEAEGDS